MPYEDSGYFVCWRNVANTVLLVTPAVGKRPAGTASTPLVASSLHASQRSIAVQRQTRRHGAHVPPTYCLLTLEAGVVEQFQDLEWRRVAKKMAVLSSDLAAQLGELSAPWVGQAVQWWATTAPLPDFDGNFVFPIAHMRDPLNSGRVKASALAAADFTRLSTATPAASQGLATAYSYVLMRPHLHKEGAGAAASGPGVLRHMPFGQVPVTSGITADTLLGWQQDSLSEHPAEAVVSQRTTLAHIIAAAAHLGMPASGVGLVLLSALACSGPVAPQQWEAVLRSCEQCLRETWARQQGLPAFAPVKVTYGDFVLGQDGVAWRRWCYARGDWATKDFVTWVSDTVQKWGRVAAALGTGHMRNLALPTARTLTDTPLDSTVSIAVALPLPQPWRLHIGAPTDEEGFNPCLCADFYRGVKAALCQLNALHWTHLGIARNSFLRVPFVGAVLVDFECVHEDSHIVADLLHAVLCTVPRVRVTYPPQVTPTGTVDPKFLDRFGTEPACRDLVQALRTTTAITRSGSPHVPPLRVARAVQNFMAASVVTDACLAVKASTDSTRTPTLVHCLQDMLASMVNDGESKAEASPTPKRVLHRLMAPHTKLA